MSVYIQPSVILVDKFKKMRFFRNESETEEVMSESSTPSTPTSPAPEPYEIKTITNADSDALLGHLRKFFFKDEPLNVAVQLIEYENSTCPELERYSLKRVCLNGTITSTISNEAETEEDDCENVKFSKVRSFLNYCGKEGTKAIAQRYPDVEKIMFVKIISTDTAWRGKGIAKELMDRTRKIGRERGYGLIRVDCSSYFSARAVARLGFECVYELKYKDYIENGQPIFQTEHPHLSFTVYVQKM
uniref:aralkylamine N-acetyltransferase n=1 Tax=Photinus pyralis TaxID=7054 RepID=A0A1Y1KBC8_PHOPY